MKPICGIYKITSPTGRIYIGQSIDCNNRISRYKKGCPKQVKLHSSLIKYGYNNHTFEVVKQCKEYELNTLEIYYSKVFNSLDHKLGLNIRECGGSKGRHSPESIEKCRIAKLGKKNTASHIMNMSKASMGRIPWNKGLKGVQKCSDATREKRRNSMIGKNKSESHTEKTRLSWLTRKLNPDWDSGESKRSRSDFVKKCWEKRKLNKTLK